MLETLNQSLFLSINAGPTSSAAARLLGVAAAELLFWLVPIALLIGWIFGGRRLRHALLVAGIAASAGLFLNQALGLVWPHPRPFVIGLGRQLIAHQPDPSFPSDHLTVVWAVAFSLLGASGTARRIGVAAALLGLIIAWGRIYVGVHFPFDMLGSAAVGCLVSVLTWIIGGGQAVRILQRTLRIEQFVLIRLQAALRKNQQFNHRSQSF
ncbi:MAG: undecaprenyl-diphosphatase [Hyphomonadaceae bacterium]|nr:undecaprenyl-diphosphatase [Hyphomonadaceae bacterium]